MNKVDVWKCGSTIHACVWRKIGRSFFNLFKLRKMHWIIIHRSYLCVYSNHIKFFNIKVALFTNVIDLPMNNWFCGIFLSFIFCWNLKSWIWDQTRERFGKHEAYPTPLCNPMTKKERKKYILISTFLFLKTN